MANYPCARNRGVPLRHFFMLVLLLTLVGLLGGCGASTTPGSSHPSGPTPTTTQGLKGMISEFRLTASNAQIGDIAVGPDRNLWFTEVIPNAQSGQIAGKIGRITPAGQIREFPLSIHESHLFGITTGPDGNLWFTEDLSNKGQSGKIGRITPSGTISEFSLSSDNQPGDITIGPDGALWFIGRQIGRITPAGQIREFPPPSSENGGAITTGPDNALWFTEFGSNIIGRLS